MIVGMPRRRAKPVEPSPSPLDALGRMAQNYGLQNQRMVDDMVKYGGATSGLGSRAADMAVGAGVKDGLGLRIAALAGDILFDPATYIGIPAVGAAAKTGARVAQLAPDTRQLYMNSLLGRLYHGAKEVPSAVLGNRGPQPQNWFQGDTFLTTSKPLARTYANEGLYRARVPLEVAERTNIMDLYKDPVRHLDIAENPGVLDYLAQAGANAVRHQSGHGMGAGAGMGSRVSINPFTGKSTTYGTNPIQEPVYAFLEPAGIEMTRMADRLGSLRPKIDNAAYRVRYTIEDLIDRIRKTGNYDPNNVL